MFHVIWI